MIWVFGILFFIPVALLAFAIMRLDLLLHFLAKDDDEDDTPPGGAPSDNPEQ